MKYPVAETFHSIQGEGTFSGTPMFFIRLAGCNVGRYAEGNPDAQMPGFDGADSKAPFPICTTAMGQKFLCDTDYEKKLVLDEWDLAGMIGSKQHICITGGEPFLHDLDPLVRELVDGHSVGVHIETSGTILFPLEIAGDDDVWITCSPKKGFKATNALHVAEWKFVLDASGDSSDQVAEIRKITSLNPSATVFVSPINFTSVLNHANVDYVNRIVSENPDWRICLQLHKILGVR